MQAEMRLHDIDANSHRLTSEALCKARLDYTLHEGFRYQMMHPQK